MSVASGAADVLYLSFDGMTDPLGRSQVLPYLVGLAARGHRIRLVSLDKPALFAEHRATVERICADAGIDWHPLPYRSGFLPASLPRNLRALRVAAQRLIAPRRPDLIHCRSDLPGLVGLALKRRHKLPVLYDMRALWPDERAEGGAWDQRRWLYRRIFRFFKMRQRDLIEQSDQIVTLAEAGRTALYAMPEPPSAPVSVIPCCADFSHFTLADPGQRAARRASLGIDDDRPLMIHLGSIGCNVMLDEMLDFFAMYRARHSDAQLLFLAPDGSETIASAARQHGFDPALHVRSASREAVPDWLAAADLGVLFVRPVWSKQAASPTKLGEMLAAGLPVIANEGVGDVAAIVRDCRAGALVERFDDAAYTAVIDQLEAQPAVPEAIRAAARRWFDLDVGVAAYDRIYREMARP